MQIKKDFYLSCPGKILISGGYSILKEGNIGVSLAIEARFYSNSKVFDCNTQKGVLIKFLSPQIESEWLYSLLDNDNEKNLKLVLELGEKNPFLEAVIKVFFTYLKILQIEDPSLLIDKKIIEVQILNDEEFYSKKCKTGKNFNNSLKFPIFDCKNLKKTGIGSSACLIVSLISSLMFSWNLIDEKVFYREEKDSKLSLIHLLSQIANIIAQNKIGSGFDISTAMYGSQIFQKFPESLITDEILKMFTMMNDFFTLKTKFFEIIEKFKIYEDKLVNIKTKNTQILMLDFTMGSDTRVLVGKVKEYLKENNQFVQDFYNDSNEMCKLLVNFLENDKGFTIENLELLRMKCGSYRQKLKLLGEYSQVEIEPDVITIIIDHLREKEKNILYSVCPGAGGYDAACFLMENDCKIDLEGYSEKIQELKEKKIKESLLEINKDLNNFNKEILEKIKGLHVSFIEKKIDKGKLNIMEF